jgi:hypothetical protein
VKTFGNFFDDFQIVDEEIRNQYIAEQYETLLEKLITFGGKAYPNFGHVVIMAGGAGSGKGFVKDNLVGLEGFVFDVDKLKTLAAATPAIQKRIKDEMGVDIQDLANNLGDSENVAKLHGILGDYLKLDDRRLAGMYTGVMAAHPDRKPNLIFDVTLKDLRKLQNITRQVKSLGYSPTNIHIVWVVNDVEVAIDQNAKRSRKVPVEILVNTHRGAANTMADILNMGKQLKSYMDGDIVFAFNKVGVDSEIAKSGRGGMTVVDANYFYVKRAGKGVTPVAKLEKDLRAKIQSYVPKNVDWS